MTTLNKLYQESKDFRLVLAQAQYKTAFRGHICFRLLNKRTGLCEAEGVQEATAIRSLHDAQRALDAVTQDPTGVLERAAEATAEKELEEALLAQIAGADKPPPASGTPPVRH
jgi:hypothetical protein